MPPQVQYLLSCSSVSHALLDTPQSQTVKLLKSRRERPNIKARRYVTYEVAPSNNLAPLRCMMTGEVEVSICKTAYSLERLVAVNTATGIVHPGTLIPPVTGYSIVVQNLRVMLVVLVPGKNQGFQFDALLPCD